MAITRLSISEFLQAAENAVLLDVRSPGEYNHAHLPGAVSLPLFTDEERKVVGTAYKQESREQAIKLGLDFFGPKMRPMVETVEALFSNRDTESDTQAKTIYVYCWRGGMRSGAVAWLLDLYGFRVFVLAGGYKAFRNHVLQSFAQPYQLKILGGYTGSGKTEVLQTLQQSGDAVVDLEGIASHKGSAFGNIDMPPQPTQEMFENMLSMALRKTTSQFSGKSIWLEDESQRIGNLNLPNELWKQMRQADIFFLQIPFEKRLEHLVKEYGVLNHEKLGDAIQRISKRLGGLETRNALAFLEEGNMTECFRILLHYYDKHYHKGLVSRENLTEQLREIDCADVTPENAQRLQSTEPVS